MLSIQGEAHGPKFEGGGETHDNKTKKLILRKGAVLFGDVFKPLIALKEKKE